MRRWKKGNRKGKMGEGREREKEKKRAEPEQ
jgi:hypothetical protein